MGSNARGSRRVGRLNIVLLVDRGPGGSKVGGFVRSEVRLQMPRTTPRPERPLYILGTVFWLVYWDVYGMCTRVHQ